MKGWRWVAAVNMAATLAGCGGGGGGNLPSTTAPTSGPVTAPPVASAGCSLRERQDWAAAQLREWYLFPETLPTSLSPAGYASVDDYVDALTATARAQRKDRYFTYLTSIKGEDAYYDAGATGGFGFRLATDASQTRLLVAEAFEGGPALAAGIDRGAEIVGIGTTASNIRTIGDIVRAGGLENALGPETPGTTRVLRVSDAGGVRDVSVAKADFALTPVSSRYGARVLTYGDKRVGYVNLRTFISTADSGLRDAFAGFKVQGITELIIDLRYNGGGLISIAELMGDLMGAGRSSSDVFAYTSFRPEKASSNETRFFSPQPQSIAPTRIAFIGTAGTASASELVINAFVPYLHAAVGLIGTNTYGKPVGQIALDQPACDDRLRVVALATENAAHFGGYFNGLAGSVEASCRANDDLTQPLGSVGEESIRTALDFLAGRGCASIDTAPTAQSASGRRALLSPERPSTAQREAPGLF